MNGPAAKRAVNPEAFVDFLTAKEHYRVDGLPRRRRLCINGVWVSENDARMIRRWRSGKIEGITLDAATAMLQRYNLTLLQYAAWCGTLHVAPMLRGQLPRD